MSDKKYIVNSDEKVVVSILTANTDETQNMPGVVDEITDKCSMATIFSTLSLIENTYDLKLPDLDIPFEAQYKGTSKCDEHDKFNERIGKYIAGGKAEMKYHIAMMKKYKKLVGLIGKAYEELYVLECEHTNKALKIRDGLTKYIDK